MLGVILLVFNTGMGGVVALRWRGGTIHGSPFVVLVLLQAEGVGFLGVVTEVVFVVVVLVGKIFWFVLTPLSSKLVYIIWFAFNLVLYLVYLLFAISNTYYPENHLFCVCFCFYLVV
jgi:hypothetical protein